MNPKRGAAKGVSLPKRKAEADAFDKLSDNPTEAEMKTAAVNVALAELEERVADVRDSWETDSLFEDAFEELSAGVNTTTAGKFSIVLSTLTFSLFLCLFLSLFGNTVFCVIAAKSHS